MRHVIRFIGLIVLATGFIGIIIDGTRSMANTALIFSSLNDLGGILFPSALEALHSKVLAHAPAWVWDDVCVAILHLPASIIGFLFGYLVLRLSDKYEAEPAFPSMTTLR